MADKTSDRNTKREIDFDLTPMVDVTFLLLIFFVLTASFTLQRSLQQSQAKVEDPSPIAEVVEPENYVEVSVDSSGVYVVSSNGNVVEAPSEREMRFQLREARLTNSANRLLITAHDDSRHRKVIAAWDAGIAAGIETINLRTTSIEF